MKTREIVRGVALATAVGISWSASAVVYRAGLKGGYVNEWNSGNYHSRVIDAIGVFNGPVAGTNTSNSVTLTTYPPIWVNNRIWDYHGQMYFDGGTYYFGKNIDDATYIAVNGSQVLKDENWNKFVATSAITLSSGWYDVVFRMGNGGGGAGCSNGTKGKDGNPLGLGYLHYASGAEAVTAPADTTDLYVIADPGDGTFLRCSEDTSLITVNSIAKTANGYSFSLTMTAPSAADVTVYAGESAGTAESATGWAANSGAVAFAAGETKTVEVVGKFATPPYFMIYLEGVGTTLAEGEGIKFWEWSDIKMCTMEPTVAPAIASVTETSASFNVTLGYDKVVEGMAAPAITLKACYGSADKGNVAEEWDTVLDFGSNNQAGVKTCAFTGLPTKQSFYVRFAVKTAESDWVWSDCFSFSTSGPYLYALSTMGENDPTSQRFLVFRPSAAAADPLTVRLAYSGATDKINGTLPATVDFASGVSVITVNFSLIDNDLEDGDKTFTVSIVPDASYVIGDPASVTITILDDETSAGEVVWTGSANDGKWETAGNWNVGRVPTVVDTVVFDDAGLSAGGTVTITTDQACCRILKIARTGAMTLAAEGKGKLKLGGVTRVDVDGTEGVHEIQVPLTIYASAGENCVWNLNGAGSVKLSAASTKSGTVYFYKTGATTLELNAEGAVPNGCLVVYEGQVTHTASGATKGTVTIGGGETAASYIVNNDTVANGVSPDVYTNGAFRLNGTHVSGGPDDFKVHEGGLIYINNNYCGKYDLWGGTIQIGYRAWSGGYTQHITAHQSDLTAYFSGNTVCSDYYDYSIKVENGAQPIDLVYASGNVDGGQTGHNFTVSGSGTMQTKGNWGTPRNISMTDTTWLMDNVGGNCGSGKGSLTVGNSATAGGTGVFGGSSESQVLTIQGSSGKVATLMPGSISMEDGSHVYGTYTVGTENCTNTLVLGEHSCLKIGVGPKNSETKRSDVDALVVHGSMTVNASNTTLDLTTNSAELEDIKGGTFTIVEADSITGTFAEVLKPKNTWKVEYVSEEVGEGEEKETVVKRIVLTVPIKGFSISIR